MGSGNIELIAHATVLFMAVGDITENSFLIRWTVSVFNTIVQCAQYNASGHLVKILVVLLGELLCCANCIDEKNKICMESNLDCYSEAAFVF